MERLELAFSLVAESVAWTGGDGTAQWCNRSFEELIGTSRSDILGKDLVALLPLEHEGARVPRASHPLTAVREGQPRVARVYELRRSDRRFTLEVEAMSATIAGEDPTIVVVLRDVTARVQAEHDMRLLNAELETVHNELEAFNCSVSHDLRAPIRSVDGFSQLLLDDYAPRLDTRGAGYLHHIRAAADRMSQLIDGLLVLSRVTRTDLIRAPVDLAALARMIAGDLHREQPERHVEFLVSQPMEVEGDARLLRLAIENLLRNAWKFTAKRARARIEFGVTREDGQLAYHLQDNGAGFDPKFARKLFTPFQRLHTTAEFPGAGIGLATVHRIVRRHGGRVWAEGSIDHGATFSFTLGT